jgi:nickel-dependent lactate racemase
MARHDFMLDVALTKSREIAGVFAGHGVSAHSTGVQFVRETLLETLPGPVDAVITTAAGYPLDLTLYQTVKGVTAAQHIVKPGGKILILAACGEGLGAPEFAAKVGRLSTYGAFLDELEHAPVEVDQWQLEKLALAGRRFDILFYTPGVPREQCGALASKMYSTPEAAVAALFHGLAPAARIAVIPEGPYVFAQVKQRAAA